jgi:hypothetical protein
MNILIPMVPTNQWLKGIIVNGSTSRLGTYKSERDYIWKRV